MLHNQPHLDGKMLNDDNDNFVPIPGIIKYKHQACHSLCDWIFVILLICILRKVIIQRQSLLSSLNNYKLLTSCQKVNLGS